MRPGAGHIPSVESGNSESGSVEHSFDLDLVPQLDKLVAVDAKGLGSDTRRLFTSVP